MVMSLMMSFVLSLFPQVVLDEIWDLIESLSEDFPIFFCLTHQGSTGAPYVFFVKPPPLFHHRSYSVFFFSFICLLSFMMHSRFEIP